MENELKKLSKKIKLISKKELAERLITNYSILNNGKYLGENGFLNYLVLQQFSNWFMAVKKNWKENITPLSTTDKCFDSEIIYNYGKEK